MKVYLFIDEFGSTWLRFGLDADDHAAIQDGTVDAYQIEVVDGDTFKVSRAIPQDGEIAWDEVDYA